LTSAEKEFAKQILKQAKLVERCFHLAEESKLFISLGKLDNYGKIWRTVKYGKPDEAC
jgi:hypothetical protein